MVAAARLERELREARARGDASASPVRRNALPLTAVAGRAPKRRHAEQNPEGVERAEHRTDYCFRPGLRRAEALDPARLGRRPAQRETTGHQERQGGPRKNAAHMNKARFEAFSDGVFAFAITLLVLGFAVPMHGEAKWTDEAGLTHALLSLWPNLISYALSFAVIGIMWQNHHALFRTVARVDRYTVFLNLLLLGSTVLIPFATATLGSYPTTHPATFLYGLVLSSCATFYNVMLWHLVRANAFLDSVSARDVQGTVKAYRVGWFTYVAATLVALFVPLASFALYILIALYYLVPRGVDDDLEVQRRRGGPGSTTSRTLGT
jgi:uncharacterized membrane protein